MGAIDRVLKAAKQSMLIDERMKVMGEGMARAADELKDHEKRLVRLETIIDIAMQQKTLPGEPK